MMRKSKRLLSDQVQAARKDIETWPKWMKDTAKFEGGDFSPHQSSVRTSDQRVRRDGRAKPAQSSSAPSAIGSNRIASIAWG